MGVWEKTAFHAHTPILPSPSSPDQRQINRTGMTAPREPLAARKKAPRRTDPAGRERAKPGPVYILASVIGTGTPTVPQWRSIVAESSVTSTKRISNCSCIGASVIGVAITRTRSWLAS